MQEVQAAQDVVRGVVEAQLARVAEVAAETARSGLHCRALGSFCRGKTETGDVDIMVVPGDHLGHVCPRCACRFSSRGGPHSPHMCIFICVVGPGPPGRVAS